LHPTATAPQGVVTRQSVVPGPPIFLPHVRGPAACADREAMETMNGLTHAAATAWRRNLLRERPSSGAPVFAMFNQAR
jgi:hypothetical protein